MKLEIFDVEHGQCSLLTTVEGGRILIDCGHNATSGWSPTTHLVGNGVSEVDRLFITNSDEDHASDLHNLRGKVKIRSLMRNPTVKSSNIFQLKSQGVGQGIRALCTMLDTYTHPIRENAKIDHVVYKSFYNKYPVDFKDENNLSVVTFFDLGALRVAFTGDMTRAGFLKLLESQSFKDYLSNTDVYIASHHGREDGCCPEMFGDNLLKPITTIISDGGKQHATQETVDWYANRTRGFTYGDTNRKVLTTRKDGNIALNFPVGGKATIELNVKV